MCQYVDRDNFFNPYKSWILFIAIFNKSASIKHTTFASRCSHFRHYLLFLHWTMRLTELMSPHFTGWLIWIGGCWSEKNVEGLGGGGVGEVHISPSVKISLLFLSRKGFFDFTLNTLPLTLKVNSSSAIIFFFSFSFLAVSVSGILTFIIFFVPPPLLF